MSKLDKAVVAAVAVLVGILAYGFWYLAPVYGSTPQPVLETFEITKVDNGFSFKVQFDNGVWFRQWPVTQHLHEIEWGEQKWFICDGAVLYPEELQKISICLSQG